MPALQVPARSAYRAAVLALLLVAAGSVQAGLFSDDEARKAILDLRARLDQMDQANRAREAELATLRRSLLDLNTTIEQLRTDLARQRGGEEQLARDVAELQRKQ